MSAYTRKKAKAKYRDRIRSERAALKQSRTLKTPYERVKEWRARKRMRTAEPMQVHDVIASASTPDCLAYDIHEYTQKSDLFCKTNNDLEKMSFSVNPLASNDIGSSAIHHNPSDSDNQHEVDTLHQVAQFGIKTEQAEDISVKLEPLDGNCLEPCDNVYDSQFEAFQTEICENIPEIKQESDNGIDVPATIKDFSFQNVSSGYMGTLINLKPSDADVNLPADCTQILAAPFTATHGNIEHPKKHQSDISSITNNRNIYETVQTPKESLEKLSNNINFQMTKQNNLFINKQNQQTFGTKLGRYTHRIQNICDVCKKVLPNRSSLVTHMRRHTGEKPFACKVCEYKCTVNSSLMRHMRIHTGEKPFACRLCKYKSSENSKLLQHMMTHTGEKPFSCELCNYKCTVNSSLVNHTRTHTGEKPFACNLCEYKCTQNIHLVRHMATHTGEKQFACKLCDYKCIVNTNLSKHMRTHTGEKPFSCKLCQYKCTVRSSLVSHMRTHTGEKPFACKLCKYKSTQNIHLVRHMRTHTGNVDL